MSNIEHNDVFELLAIDMDMPQEEIKDTLLSKGTNEFIHFIKKEKIFGYIRQSLSSLTSLRTNMAKL